MNLWKRKVDTIKRSRRQQANGYYERKVACFLGSLRVSLPRDRKGQFRPPFCQTSGREQMNLFRNFFKFCSKVIFTVKIKALLQSIKLHYLAEQIEEIKEEVYHKADEKGVSWESILSVYRCLSYKY